MAAADTAVQSSVIVNELLNEENYEQWKVRVKTYLLSKGLWNLVGDDTERPRGKAKLEAWSKINAEALHAIHICCGSDAFKLIQNTDSAKDAWTTLATNYGVHKPEEEAEIEPDEPEKEVEKEVVEGDENNANDNPDYETFFRDLKDFKWDVVMQFIEKYGDAVRERDPSDGQTVLHYAVDAVQVEVVKKLLPLMKASDLEIEDYCDETALDYCCIMPEKYGMVEIAKCLVQKKKDLPGGVPLSLLIRAFINDRPKMTRYLYKAIPLDTKDPNAAELISLSFSTKRFEIACDLIQRHPSLAIAEDLSELSPFNELACTPSAFLSGCRLKFWEKWIYDVIYIKSTPSLTVDNKGDAIIDVPIHGDDKDKRRGLIRSVTALFQGPIIENISKFFGISRMTRIYQMKLNHVRSREILSCMCKVVTKEMKNLDEKQVKLLEKAIFQAAERGLVEFLTPIFTINPTLAKIKNDKSQNIFQVAVECRQEKVFNLINGFSKDSRDIFINSTDDDDNNMLHMVGLFSPFAQTNRIRGAALQMQNELQWFKELEGMACPEDLEAINDTHDMKPRDFFSMNHKELVKEGEKAMKETATSCTVVGALIVTMMFAAAFTLPGGNTEDSGAPLLLYRRAFRVFIIADAISLFTSTTSVMLFLGILTSRYAEDDFLRSLPQKMILGLLTLFLSVSAMVIVFASALFLILPSDTRIALPTTLLTGIPIASFIWMQFPFLVEIFRSTYIPGTFNKKVPRWEKE